MSELALTMRKMVGWKWPIDRVWTAFALVLATLLAVVPAQGFASLDFVLSALWNVAPFLAASVLIAAYAQASGADNLIAGAFHGRAVQMIPLAAVFGALSPFCSCGVIPLIAALLAIGVPLAPVMAFWLASPLMDPAKFVLAAGVVGTEFAVAQTVAAIGVGLLGGVAIYLFQRAGAFSQVLREGAGNGGCGGAKIRNPKAVHWRFWEDPARRQSFGGGALKNTLFLGKWLSLAFLLESLLLAYVPVDMVVRYVGGDGLMPVLAATAVGVPAYFNGFAALPLVGGLMEQGMDPGAALAFLVAGGVTSLPAALAVYALARKSVFAAYIGLSLVGAVSSGLLFQLWLAA